jgi:hypothetical protein
VAAAEKTGKQSFEAAVDVVKGFLESRPCFAINTPYGMFERFQCRAEIGMLRIQIGLALRLFGELTDGRQIDRPETLHRSTNRLQSLIPIAGISIFGQLAFHISHRYTGCGKPLGQRFTAHFEFANTDPQLLNELA